MSDVHGSIYYLKKALEKFVEEKADYIVMLGDALYHGPRNPLPKDYKPSEVAYLLNEYKDKIIAIKGNCDSEVDQMVLEFPILAEYTIILHNGIRIFATHGHKFNKENLPNISAGDVLVHGHTHLPVAEKYKGISILNPGSITLPKENNPNSYGIITNENVFTIKDFDGNMLKELKL